MREGRQRLSIDLCLFHYSSTLLWPHAILQSSVSLSSEQTAQQVQLLKALVSDSLVLLDCLEKNGLQACLLAFFTYILYKYLVRIIYLVFSDDTMDFKTHAC